MIEQVEKDIPGKLLTETKIQIPERTQQKLADLNSHIMIMQKQFNDILDVFFEVKGLSLKDKKAQMSQDFSEVTLIEDIKKE